MKPHYPILDGLRGVAAVLVVLFHIGEVHYHHYDQHPIHHGYLAVDFFFLLSGFVVGYAYDDRWGRLSTWDFFKLRLARLHPLILLSTVLGVVCYRLGSYTNGQYVSTWQLLAAALLSLAVLPGPDLRGWGETHSLNGPLWSLLQEYLANVLYALVGRRLGRGALGALVLASAGALVGTALRLQYLAVGWSYATWPLAGVRMLFPFCAGLLLFRSGRRLRVPAAFPVCSLVLAGLFCLPYFRYNGLYEAACIVLAFPVLVAAGAGGQVAGGWARVCKFLGDLSYPLYLTHYPLINFYTGWVSTRHLTRHQALPLALGVLGLALLLAYAALKLYDEPVRAWLRRRLLPQP